MSWLKGRWWPFANTFRLRPINFTDPGTINGSRKFCLLENQKKAAPGLPNVSYALGFCHACLEDVLTDYANLERLWPGEYVTAGVVARQREEMEH